MNKPLLIPALVLALAPFVFAKTTYTWQNSTGTGILNTPANWSPALAPLVVNDVYSIPLPAAGGGAFRLNDDLVASTFRVSDGSTDGAPAVFNLGGNFLCVTNIGNTGYLDIFTGNPVVFLNGMLQTRFYLRLGIDADRTVPVRLAFTNVVAQSVTYYTRYAPTITATFCDCFLTNFPRGGINSNTHLDFTRSVYSLKTKNVHHGASSGATNVTMRFADGCTFDRYNYAFHFGGNGATKNCHYIFESGSDLRYKLGISGENNSVAFTNADLFGQFILDGADSVYLFHDAIVSNYPASNTLINNLQGNRNLLSFTGPRTQTYMQYLDFAGTGNRLVFGEGVQSTGKACAIRVSGGSGHTIRADPGSAIRASLSMGAPDCTAAFTNATFRGGAITSSGVGNRLLFHDSIVSNAPASGTVINSVSGSDALLSFTGPASRLWAQYIDISGQRHRFLVGDNMTLTNRSFALRFGSYSRDSSLEVGTNTLLKVDYIDCKGTTLENTNIVVRIGKGSTLFQTGRGDLKSSTFGGVNFRFVLDNAEFRYVSGTTGQVLSSGGSCELLGDDAKMTILNSYGAIGCLQLGNSIGEGAPPLTMRFRPGTTGFHGEPPIYIASPGYSYIRPTVVFDVDATAYARGKPGGVHDIPLIRKGKKCTYSIGAPDLDALNAIGIFTPADGRLVFDDQDNIVFRFKRNCSTRLMLR